MKKKMKKKTGPKAAEYDYGIYSRMRASADLTGGKKVMFEFCAAVRRDEPLSKSMLGDIATRFEQVLSGIMSADLAFDLARSPGAQKTIDWQEKGRRISIAGAVLKEKQRTPNRTIKRIAELLVDSYREKASFIDDCYEQYREEARHAMVMVDAINANDFVTMIRELEWLGARGITALNLPPPRSPSK